MIVKGAFTESHRHYLELPEDTSQHEMMQYVLDVLSKPNVRVSFMRGVKAEETKDGWYSYTIGKTFYCVISSGPIDAHVENSIKAALGHDPMSFVKGD